MALGVTERTGMMNVQKQKKIWICQVNVGTIAKSLDPVKLWCPRKKSVDQDYHISFSVDPSCEMLPEDAALSLSAVDESLSLLSGISSPLEAP